MTVLVDTNVFTARPIRLLQCLRLQPGGDKLGQERHTAASGSDQIVERSPVHRPVEDGLEEPIEVGRGQRRQFDARTQAVFAQRRDRLRGGLTSADRRHDEGGPGGRDLMEESGAGLVEEMGVVDGQDEPPASGARQGLDDGQEKGEPVGPLEVVSAEQAGERTERDRGRRPRGHEPFGGESGWIPVVRLLEGFVGQAAPPHARPPAQHETSGTSSADGGGHDVQHIVPSDEGPARAVRPGVPGGGR